jgi:glycogen synthase
VIISKAPQNQKIDQEQFMPEARNKLRVAMAAWEIGRVFTGLGTKLGGLAVIVEELPPELVKAAARQGIDLEVELLSPCYAHYDKSRLTKLDLHLPVTIGGHTFEFEAYEHIFPDGQKAVYFWDAWQLGWTNANAIYPDDPQMAAKLFAAVGQAMAGYIRQSDIEVVHLHDYHVGLVPFYLGDDYLQHGSVHLTIHNATHQGIIYLVGGGYNSLDRLNLSGEKYFHKYFDYFDNLNLMKACMLKVHESGGRVTTVSGDIAGTWGYAAELRETHAAILARAEAQKGGPVGRVFHPNNHLDLFEKLPIAGITNGMGDRNRPENLPELKAEVLRAIQEKQDPHAPLFANPTTQAEMLARDHTFDADHLEVKRDLRRLLYLEAFGHEPYGYPIVISVIGRLVEQKNLGLVADVVEWVLAYDNQVKFTILASPLTWDGYSKTYEGRFFDLAHRYPGQVYFNNTFNIALSKLMLAGSDFTLIPSRFEPCGLVDYEASLVGTVVIGRLTGGLAKVRHCAYLYEWLDIGDWWGEVNALFHQIKAAIDTVRHNYVQHLDMVRRAMAINASWDASADQYVKMYRYGLLAKKWLKERQEVIQYLAAPEERRQRLQQFIQTLNGERAIFAEFFAPAYQEYSNPFDWELKEILF